MKSLKKRIFEAENQNYLKKSRCFLNFLKLIAIIIIIIIIVFNF